MRLKNADQLTPNQDVRWDRVRRARKGIAGGLYDSNEVIESTLTRVIRSILGGSKRRRKDKQD